ncbi:MAG: discoidin domain-containing protein [Archangium sp.]
MNRPLIAALVLSCSACGPESLEAGDELSVTEQALTGTCGTKLNVVSASATVQQDGNPPSGAVDGSLVTRWSGKGAGATLTADFGSLKEICNVAVAWYQGDTRANTFRIETSQNGTSWSQVYSGTSALNTSLQIVSIPLTTARYLRLVWLSSTANNGWASVNELQAFGGDAFVLGQTKPTAANTGAGKIRPYPTRVLNGDQTITVAGTRLEDAIVHGRVIVKADNVVISNCVVDGGDDLPASAWSLIVSERSNLRIEHTTVFAKKPTLKLNGIGMRNYTAYRVDVSGVIDAFSSAPATFEGPVNVSIQGSYGHDLVHFSPDPGHPATPTNPESRTHNDVVQSHGGTGLQIIGSNFSAYHHPTLGTQPAPHKELAAIMVNTNGTYGRSLALDVRDNWFGGGVHTINAIGDANGSGSFLRNRFDRGATVEISYAASFVLTQSGNVFEDNGAPIRLFKK